MVEDDVGHLLQDKSNEDKVVTVPPTFHPFVSLAFGARGCGK